MGKVRHVFCQNLEPPLPGFASPTFLELQLASRSGGYNRKQESNRRGWGSLISLVMLELGSDRWMRAHGF